MADTKISQLPAATTPLSGAEVVPLVQSGATVQTPVNDLSLLTAATANTFTANQIISVTDNTNAALRVTQLGTGLALRIEDSANPDSSPFVVDNAGNVGVGTAAPPVYAGYTNLAVDGTDSNLDLARGGVRQAAFYTSATQTVLGTIANVPLRLGANNNNFVSVGTDQSLTLIGTGGLGYGTGSGGTVTQLTSRSTSVTLNKTNGAITLFTAAPTVGTWVTFQVINATVTNTDTVIANIKGGAANTYIAHATLVGPGNFYVTLTSVSGTTSDAPVINFSVIKAVTS